MDQYIKKMIAKITDSLINQKQYYHVFTNRQNEKVEFYLMLQDKTTFIRANMESQKGHHQWFDASEYKTFLNFYGITEESLIAYLEYNLLLTYVYMQSEINELDILLGKKKCLKAVTDHKQFCEALSGAINKNLNPSPKHKFRIIHKDS